MKLGKMKRIQIRQAFLHEADLDKGLLSDDNITTLGEEIDMTLCDFERQKQVGPFRCDIVCKEANTNRTVVIENQFNETNHDHLGKLISYASNLNATAIIGIVEDVDNVHQSAIEGLNKHTDNTISFYLVQVQAGQIDDSLPAPKFVVLEEPNDANKAIVPLTKEIVKVGPKRQNTLDKRLKFGQIFNKKLSEIHDLPFSTYSKPSDRAGFDCRVSSSKYHLSLVLKNAPKGKYLRVGVGATDKKQYEIFEKNKSEFDSAIPSLIWDSKPDSENIAEFFIAINGLDLDDESNGIELMDKAIEYLFVFERIAKKYRLN